MSPALNKYLSYTNIDISSFKDCLLDKVCEYKKGCIKYSIECIIAYLSKEARNIDRMKKK